MLHFCHFSSEFKQDQAGVDIAKVGVDVAMLEYLGVDVAKVGIFRCRCC